MKSNDITQNNGQQHGCQLSLFIMVLAMVLLPCKFGYSDQPVSTSAWVRVAPNLDWKLLLNSQNFERQTRKTSQSWKNESSNDISESTNTSDDGIMVEPANSLVLHTGISTTLTIPPPNGFLSVKRGTELAQLYEIFADNSCNGTLVHWVSIKPESGEVDGSAYVTINKELGDGRVITSGDIQKLCKFFQSDQHEFEDDMKRSISERASAINEAISETIGSENMKLEIEGYRLLPPHRVDPHRLAFTVIMSQKTSDKNSIEIVNSCMLLLHGRCFWFYMTQDAKDNGSIDEDIAESRLKMDAWSEVILKVNNVLSRPERMSVRNTLWKHSSI